MRSLALLLALAGLTIPGPAVAATDSQPIVGIYEDEEGPDVAGMMQFLANGKFVYALSAGALDEHSQGSWTESDGVVTLSTEPRPVPPEFRKATVEGDNDGAYLMVTWPNGEAIAGVDFRIGFDGGDPYQSYTQYYGASLPEDEKREPRWIELSEPIHRVTSQRIVIPSGTKALHFEMVPNDIGIVDLTGAKVERTSEGGLILHHPSGDIRFRPAAAP